MTKQTFYPSRKEGGGGVGERPYSVKKKKKSNAPKLTDEKSQWGRKRIWNWACLRDTEYQVSLMDGSIQCQSDPSWATTQRRLGTVPSCLAALLLQRSLGASDAHMHPLYKSTRVILDTSPLWIALSSTRRLCKLLPTAGVPGLVHPHLLLQWMQQHKVCQAAKLISLSSSCAPPALPCLPDQGLGEMIIAVSLCLFLPSWDLGGAAVHKLINRHTGQPPILIWILQRGWGRARNTAKGFNFSKRRETWRWEGKGMFKNTPPQFSALVTGATLKHPQLRTLLLPFWRL